MEKYAYTTVLSTDNYLPGVLALYDSINRTNTKIEDFVVIVNQLIKKETINSLTEKGIIVRKIPKINIPEDVKNKNKLFPHWNNTFDKFNIFDLIEYDKVVYLDSDIYVSENIDDLFEKENMSAVIAGKSFYGNKYWEEINSGVMVVKPEEGIREDLINKLREMCEKKKKIRKSREQQKNKRFSSNISILKLKDKICKQFQGIGDQDVLEEYFDWKNKPELHLSEEFNVFANYSDFYKEKLGINPKCYHFIGAKKPWNLTLKEKINSNMSKTKPVENKAFSEYEQIIYDNADQYKANFSIIIPMKNAEEYVDRTLNSIKSQQYENVEIIVVDDNSSDNSRHCVENFRKENQEFASKIKMFETENGHRGPGAGRNVGLDNAVGDYIVFLDADDILNEDALNKISRTIALNPEADIFSLGFQLTRLDLDEKIVGNMKINSGNLQESRFFQIGANTAGQIWNVCARRSMFETGKKLRFKENCKFEDLPTKVELFTRTKKKIKSVPYITHTQFSRPAKSVTGSLNIRDMKRLIDANLEIANIIPEVDLKDKMYIEYRMIMMPAILSWFVQKCIHNKIDLYKMMKKDNDKEIEI